MSATEIQALCELYIGRKFDDADTTALREFLRDLQVQKPKKVVAAEKEEKPSKAFQPIAERKQNLAPSVVAPGDRPAPVSLSEFGGSGAKERKNAYTQTIASQSEVSASKDRIAADLADAKIGVADRKAQWAAATSEAPLSPRSQSVALDSASPRARDRMASYEQNVLNAGASTKDELIAERLAEVKGVTGVKDRQAAYSQATSSPTNKDLVNERLAEVKGVPGVKDRLGNWQQTDAPETPKSDPNAVAERLSEVKGVAGVKDRLGQWNKVVESSDKSQACDPSKVEERLAELGKTGVKDRVGGWSNKTDAVVASTSGGLAEERTSELKKTTSVRDRLASYSQVATDDKVVERAPVYIPTDVSELPTKETQGQ